MRTRTIGLRALVIGGLALGLAGVVEARAQETGKRADGDIVVVDTRRGLDLDETEQVRVRIRNTVVPARSVVVSVQGGTRPEYVLGVVRSNETREFIVDSRLFVGGFRVLATSGRFAIRNSVRAVGSTRSTWNLGVNLMKFERLEPAKDGDTGD